MRKLYEQLTSIASDTIGDTEAVDRDERRAWELEDVNGVKFDEKGYDNEGKILVAGQFSNPKTSPEWATSYLYNLKMYLFLSIH